jgi:hypothetical protein
LLRRLLLSYRFSNEVELMSESQEQESQEQTVTQEDRDKAKKGYPNQTFSDKDLEMLKALGHL